MLSASITVPGTLNALGTPIALTSFQYGQGLTVQLPATAAAGEQVAFYGGNISNATSVSQLQLIEQLSIPAAGGDGRSPTPVGNLASSYLYLYAVRTAIQTAGALTATVVGQETAGTSGGSSNPNAILQGGNAFGATINIGPTDGQAMVIGGTFTNSNCTSLTLDTTTTGPVNLGTNANAKTVTIGNNTVATNVVVTGGAAISQFTVASGGQLRMGGSSASFTNTADSFQARTINNGPISLVAAGSGNAFLSSGSTGAVSITGGSSGVGIDTSVAGPITIGSTFATSVTIAGSALATINIGNTALATALTLGNTTSTTAVTIRSGSGGIGIGTAAPAGSSIAIDTTTTITIGATSATAVTIGNTTGAMGVTVNSGTGGISASATGTGVISLASGTGVSQWTIGATGTLNLAADANAHTVNIASGAAANLVTIGSLSGASALTLQSGSGNMLLNAGGSNSCTVTAGTINIATAASAATVSIGTGAAVIGVTMGSTNSTSSTTIQSGTGDITLAPGATGNTAIGATGSFGSGQRVLFLANAVANPSTNPTGGGVLYVNAGALTYRGSSGTVTVLGAA